jgi:hypothetical protein
MSAFGVEADTEISGRHVPPGMQVAPEGSDYPVLTRQGSQKALQKNEAYADAKPTRQALYLPPSCRQARCDFRSINFAGRSNTFKVLDQILLVCVAEVEFELRIIVVDHVKQRRKASVVKEATLLMRPQTRERGRAVHVGC